MSLGTPRHARNVVVSQLPPVDIVVDARQPTHRRVAVPKTSVPSGGSACAGPSGTGLPEPVVTGEHRVCCLQPKKCRQYALRSGKGRPPAGEIADKFGENAYSGTGTSDTVVGSCAAAAGYKFRGMSFRSMMTVRCCSTSLQK